MDFVPVDWLTHWGRATHICVCKLIIIGSDNGLSPGRRQAIIWIIAGILLTRPLGTNYSEIIIEIYTFSFKKMHLKLSSGNWQPFCPGLNVLKIKFTSFSHAAPSSVRNITVSMTESGDVYVHWNEPSDLSGPLTVYDLSYQQVGIGDCPGQVTGGIQTFQYPSTTTSVALTNLRAWTRYRIEVTAVNSAGRSTQESTFITYETSKVIYH